MKRPLVYLSLLLVIALAGTAVAGLNKTDKKKLARAAGKYFDPDSGEDAREEARDAFVSAFRKNKKKELGDVDTLGEILANAGDRSGSFRGVKEITIESGWIPGQKFKALVSVPKKYRGSGAPWPMIFSVPDDGQKAKAHLDQYWLSPTIRDSYVIVVLEFNYSKVTEVVKETKKDEDGRVTFEEKKVVKDFSWSHLRAQAQFWETLLNVLIKHLKVDPNRIIVEGAGKGASGSLAMSAGQPWRFAGLIVRGGEYEGANITNLKNLKVLSLPLATAGEGAKKTAEKLKAAGGEKNFKAGSNDPKWSGAKEEGTEMLAWLTTAVRDRYPLPSSWEHTDPDADPIGYWCHITGRFDTKASASISIETKGNEIKITTKNVRKFDLYLNDKLVNLGKPFKLKLNDEDPREMEVTRDPQEVLAHAFAGGGKWPNDPGCVFVAEVKGIIVAPPAEKKDDGKKDDDKKDDKKTDDKKDADKKDGK